LAVVLLVSAGCDGATPSLSLAPSPTIGVAASPPTATPFAASPPTQPGSTRKTVEVLGLEPHRIPAKYAGHMTALMSLGDAIIWAGGQRDGDSNLYRFAPGGAEPELVFLNPRHDSVLTSIAGSAAGYVFADERWAGGQPRGWRLWFLAAAGAEPMLLDQSTDDRLPSPTLAMNERYIAWEVVHGSWEDRTNELLVAAVDDPLAAVTLRSLRGTSSYLEYPGLWADELWYGIVDNDWDAGAEYPRIEMIDLRNPSAMPQAFGADQRAFMPAPARDVVAWKSGGEKGLSALNSGALTVYWRTTGSVETLPIPGPANAADRITHPSVGDRFVTWWDDIHQRFYVYDLGARRFRRIAEYDWAQDEAVFMQSLSGDLLAYMHRLNNGDSFLEWGLLPD
jgi:hypothetical protein